MKDKETLYSNSIKIIKNGDISSAFLYDDIIASYIKELRLSSIPVNITDVIIYSKK